MMPARRSNTDISCELLNRVGYNVPVAFAYCVKTKLQILKAIRAVTAALGTKF